MPRHIRTPEQATELFINRLLGHTGQSGLKAYHHAETAVEFLEAIGIIKWDKIEQIANSVQNNAFTIISKINRTRKLVSKTICW